MINWPIPEKCNKKIRILHTFSSSSYFLTFMSLTGKLFFFFVWQSPTHIGNIWIAYACFFEIALGYWWQLNQNAFLNWNSERFRTETEVS